MNFLEMLRKPKATAAELRAAIAELSVNSAEGKVTDLEAKRREVLLGGNDAEVDRLDKEIVAGNREVERIAAAIEELTLRIGEAEDRERAAEITRRTAENCKTWTAMRDAYLSLHEAATKAAASIAEIKQHEEQLRATNLFLIEHGCGDLELSHPMTALNVMLGRPAGNIAGVNEFKMPGYWPRHPDNLNFGNMKDLALPRA